MKNKIIFPGIVLIAFLAVFNARGQAPDYVGIKGGISIPNLTSASSSQNDWDEGYSSRVGPNFGVLAEFRLSKLVSFQPEVNFIGEGGKRNGIQPFAIPEEYVPLLQSQFQTDKDYVYADFKNVSRLNYLQIPLMAKFSFSLSQDERLKFFAQAGPFVSFLVGASQIIKTDDLKVYLDKEGEQQIPPQMVQAFLGSSIDTTIDARHELHKSNVGVQGGIGLSLDCGKGKIFIEGGGNYGFIPVQKGDKHGKNNIGAATIAVGYALKLHE